MQKEAQLDDLNPINFDTGPQTIDDVAHQFSFDLRLFHRRIDNGDDWQKTIQGHLFLDHELTKTLEEGLAHPERISLDRMSFSSKLDFCSAMGLVEPKLEAMIRRINKLRNNISHDLQFLVLEQHAKEIRDLSPPFALNLLNIQINENKSSLLTNCLKVAIVTLDMNRQILSQQREQEKKRTQDLNAAIENARRVLEQIDPLRKSQVRDDSSEP